MSIIDASSMAVQGTVTTGPDSSLAMSVFVAQSSTRAYLPQTRLNATNPALLFDTTAFPIVSAIDLTGKRNLPQERIAIDIADRPSNMPADAVVTAGRRMYVANAGSDDVSVIDLVTGRAIALLPGGQ
jgi:YVTN family beta-propeller protein